MSTQECYEIIVAYGHENIQATHPSTLMFTKDAHLSKNGDCIVAVSAEKGLMDLGETFKETLKRENSKLKVTIETDGLTETIYAFGSPKLTLSHPTDIVIRKSEFISDRTLAVRADKASSDLPRQLVDKLKNPKQKIKVTLKVEI